jgi:NAD(P)-dependent dehydrogenase (short-subunit alcohol dehydrogenase family)
MSKLVTIFGGSGFVGRYIARRMAKEGWRVRVAVRRPNEAIFVRPYGTVGQVEPVLANIRDDDSVRAAIHGADAVVNCVGILAKRARTPSAWCSIMAPHASPGLRPRRAWERWFMSRPSARTRTATAAMRKPRRWARPRCWRRSRAVILRPSIVFGPEDEFFNRFAQMTRMGPCCPSSAPTPGFSRSMWTTSPGGRHGRDRRRPSPASTSWADPRCGLPRTDAADAGRHPPPPPDRERAVLDRRDHGHRVRHACRR